jgi:molecular chaperone GrpE
MEPEKNIDPQEEINEEEQQAAKQAFSEEFDVLNFDFNNIQIARLEEEIADLKDRLIRSAADMENLRKRHEKELADARNYAVTNFAKQVSELIENLFRAYDNIPHEEGNELFNNLANGIGMTLDEGLKMLEKNGIYRLYPIGEKFDHNFHQAVMQIESGEHEEGTVMQVMQAGYVINGRLLQPAIVAVSKLPA